MINNYEDKIDRYGKSIADEVKQIEATKKTKETEKVLIRSVYFWHASKYK